jgi:hypothetical protein
MGPKTTISLNWDNAVNIRHTITGYRPGPPKDDILLWILAPSVPLFLAHQFGAMKPSHGLIVSGWILEMLFHNRYTLMPINSALRSAQLDIVYTDSPAVKLLFRPKHAAFANSDSLEEGVRQLLNNCFHYVYSQLDDYNAILFRTVSTTAIGLYYEFLEERVAAGAIGRGKDLWSLKFTAHAAWLIGFLSENGYVLPQGDHTEDDEKWALAATDHLTENYTRLMSMRDSLLPALGLY